jgi:hypothetical protein
MLMDNINYNNKLPLHIGIPTLVNWTEIFFVLKLKKID